MTHKIQRRMAILLGLIGLVMVVTVWVGQVTWQRVDRLNERLTTSQFRSFQTADQFRANLQSLNTILFRYQIHQDPADWSKFLLGRQRLDEWIDRQQPLLSTAEERAVLGKINSTYDDYYAAARALEKAAGKVGSSDVMERIEQQTERLIELDNALVGAHRASLNGFLRESHDSLNLLRVLMFGALVVLLALGCALAVVAYLEMVQPLRRKLVETQAIVERQEKLASLGVLAAGVAHEIRNPLTAIKARLFIQQKNLRPGSRESGDAAFIGDEINRLERIIKDFLRFARPSEPDLELVTASKVIQEARELMSPHWCGRGVDLRLGELADSQIRVDRQQIKQVLINLIHNAAESIEGTGTVTLSCREVQRKQNGTGGEGSAVVLEVSDTGRGIPPEIQKRLFDPFFSTKDGGTGLGLSIAARIVEKHAGQIEFQTEPRRGTTFGVILPQAV